jgi:adenine-specific DNA-methyltransferase
MRDPAGRGATLDGFDPTDADRSYARCVPDDHRRRLGQVFTPEPVARLMASWLAGCRPRSLLDPAVGTGVLLRCALERFTPDRIVAVDIDPLVLAAARAALDGGPTIEFKRHDFLTWPDEQTFDAIIANPPYLKHHNFHYDHDVFDQIGRRSGVTLSRLSNLYVLFILEIGRRLGSGGRAAIIVPGEWTNANFGRPLKKHLLESGLLRTLLYFSHGSLVFEGALTTASILLLAKPPPRQTPRNVRSIYIGREPPWQELEELARGGSSAPPGVVVRALGRRELLGLDKWDHALAHGIDAVGRGFVRLGDLAHTSRGIATGANAFFHLALGTARRLGLGSSSLLPCVGRAADVRRAVFTKADFAALVRAGRRTHLLNVNAAPTAAQRRYLQQGQAMGLPRRYLLVRRRPWYAMEKRQPAPIWAAVFGRRGIRFVLNEAGVHNLTAFHCIYPTSGSPLFHRALVAVLNSPPVQELARRHRRVYGGGLHKVEPRDLLELPVPDLRRMSSGQLRKLARGCCSAGFSLPPQCGL